MSGSGSSRVWTSMEFRLIQLPIFLSLSDTRSEICSLPTTNRSTRQALPRQKSVSSPHVTSIGKGRSSPATGGHIKTTQTDFIYALRIRRLQPQKLDTTSSRHPLPE